MSGSHGGRSAATAATSDGAWPVLYLADTMVRGAVSRSEFTGLGEQEAGNYPYRLLGVSMFEVVPSSIFVAALLVGCGLAFFHDERWLESRTALGEQTN